MDRSLRHIAREGRCYVLGANPCLGADQIPTDIPHREALWPDRGDGDGWVEPGNSVIVDPYGEVLAGPARHEEIILTAEIELQWVRSARRLFDAVGHYNRPDVFQADGGHVAAADGRGRHNGSRTRSLR